MDDRSPAEIQRMASIYQKCGKLELAEQLYWTLFSTSVENSHKAVALVRLGELCSEQGRPAEGSVYFKRAIELWGRGRAS